MAQTWVYRFPSDHDMFNRFFDIREIWQVILANAIRPDYFRNPSITSFEVIAKPGKGDECEDDPQDIWAVTAYFGEN